MSLDAMRWAFQQTNLRSPVKFVLVALADRANHDNECWPSRELIAADCCMSAETVSKATEELVQLGLIEKHRSFSGPVVYRLIGVESRHPSAEKSAKGKLPPSFSGKVRHPLAEVSAPNLSINQSLEPKDKSVRFRAPSVPEISAYAAEHGYTVNADAFHAYYESNGWRVGRNPMRCWRRAVASWHHRDAGKPARNRASRTSITDDLTDRSWAQ